MSKSPYDRRWQARRAWQLSEYPLCRMCMELQNRIEPATVADHITPHRGDPALFWGPLQSLCASCHSSIKQQIETTGRIRGSNADGTPIDPSDPWHKPGGSR